MKKCLSCKVYVKDEDIFCSNCGSSEFEKFEEAQGSENQINQEVLNDYIQDRNPFGGEQTEIVQEKKPSKIGAAFAKIGMSFIGTLVVSFVLIMITGSQDLGIEEKLIGTWTYTEHLELQNDFEFDATVYLELTDGHYRWYIDEDKTMDSLVELYEKQVAYYGITEESVQSIGYDDIEDYVDDLASKDLDICVEMFEEDVGKGTWRIYEGKFIFKPDGDTEESQTLYELDGDTLELKTDGITLERVD